jgi:hypothetical protein
MYSDPDFFTALRMNEQPVTALAGTLLDETFISRPPRTCPYQRVHTGDSLRGAA